VIYDDEGFSISTETQRSHLLFIETLPRMQIRRMISYDPSPWFQVDRSEFHPQSYAKS